MGEGIEGEAVGVEESQVEAQGGEKRQQETSAGPGHLLRDHLLDLWLHVSVHCFSCRRWWGGDGDENQSH